jgi:signal transduction histidine kinase
METVRMATAVRFLRASFGRRALDEVVFVIVGVVLGMAGFLYVAVTLYLGGVLALSVIGLPLLVWAVTGSRRIGDLHRHLAARLLDLWVPVPRRRLPEPGLIGWLKAGLLDAAGWRSALYLLAKLPVALLSFAVMLLFWVYGLAGLTYAAWRPFLPYEADSHGGLHQGVQWFFPDSFLDTWPRILAVLVAGALLTLAAPWALRVVLRLDRLLIRALLSPTKLSERVSSLEQTRAHAVDDSAAALRRIERNLHDGAQARLVALAMKLGMAREELDGDDPEVAVARARTLVEVAHRGAKEALVELRDLARGIHPPVLDKGLDAALATLAAASAVPVRLRVELRRRPEPAIETIAYFCTAELLTNVAKHRGARHAAIELTERGGRLSLLVRDDGRGGARVQARGGGLAGLADRVGTVDGSIEVGSPPGGPTVVTVTLPSRVRGEPVDGPDGAQAGEAEGS